MGRGTLASGHPSFPLSIVAVPDSSAERLLIIAFAARHHEQGNNLNLSRSAVLLAAGTLSTGVPFPPDDIVLSKCCSNSSDNNLQAAKSRPNPLQEPPCRCCDGTLRPHKILFAILYVLIIRTVAIAISNGLFPLPINGESLGRIRTDFAEPIASFFPLSKQGDFQIKIHEKPVLLINHVCNMYIVVEVFAYQVRMIKKKLHQLFMLNNDR